MALYDISKREASEDVFRLAGVELYVPTDEQLAKARAKYADIKGSVSLKVRWQPMTYRKYIGDEEVTEEVDYIKMTKSSGIADDALPIIRDAGINAVPSNVIIALPTNPAKADPDKQTQEYPRFMVAATKAGIIIDVNDDGTLTSPQIGQLFRCRNGFEEFPTPSEDANGRFKWDWEDTRSTFMRVPLAPAKDFVQPDELREFRYERKEAEEGGAAGGAATTTASAGAVSADDIAAGVRALGINGLQASMVNQNALAIVSSQVAAHRSLATLVAAAQANTLVDELAKRGLVEVSAEGIITVG